jgi:transposase-like protein
MKKGEYSSYEDVLLVQAINRNVGPTGVIQWRKMQALRGRDMKSMQNRWMILRKKHKWNGERYNLIHVPRKYEGTKKQKVEQYLANNPDARPKDICSDLNVNHNTVYAVRRNMRQEGLIPTKGNATPIADVVNARKTPQNASTGVLPKRVVVKKSFLWGAFTFERYE